MKENMKVSFLSNYLNHHQTPMSDVIYEELKENYHFIQTQPMELERVQMGWQVDLQKSPYLCKYYDEKEKCDKILEESDIIIFGGIDDESYIKKYIEQGKIVLRYSERFYKDGVWKAISPNGLKKKYEDHTKYRNYPAFLLCAGGYVAYDYSIVHSYPNKMFKWGYFPEFISYPQGELSKKKENDTIQILWAGRMIDWKHPETVIHAAKELVKTHKNFHITLIGGGPMEDELKQEVIEENLSDFVTFAGYHSPEEVREYMENSAIYLFTSDYHEGWGAVLNEAMNSGCAVVANHAIGAVPYLIKDGINGLIYENEKEAELVNAVSDLIHNPYKIKKLGENAYETIEKEWNPRNAALSLLRLCENLCDDKLVFEETGPLSKAEVVKQRDMYRYLKGEL